MSSQTFRIILEPKRKICYCIQRYDWQMFRQTLPSCILRKFRVQIVKN